MDMKRIILNGFAQPQVNIQLKVPTVETTEFEIIQSVKFAGTREAGNKIEIHPEEEDIVYLEFEDGGEWFGSALDIAEIRGLEKPSDRSGNSVEWSNRIYLSESTSDRNVVKSIVVKAFHLIRPKV